MRGSGENGKEGEKEWSKGRNGTVTGRGQLNKLWKVEMEKIMGLELVGVGVGG